MKKLRDWIKLDPERMHNLIMVCWAAVLIGILYLVYWLFDIVTSLAVIAIAFVGFLLGVIGLVCKYFDGIEKKRARIHPQASTPLRS